MHFFKHSLVWSNLCIGVIVLPLDAHSSSEKFCWVNFFMILLEYTLGITLQPPPFNVSAARMSLPFQVVPNCETDD